MAHRRNRVSHAKEAFYIVCILLALLIGLFSIVGPKGYLDMKNAQTELEAHRARVESLKKSNQELERSIDALRSDPKAIEGLARKKRYAKKGEIILEVPEAAPATDSRPQSGRK